MSFVASPSRPRIAGVALLAGVIGFLAIERVAVASYPGFDPALQPLSGLGNLGAPTRELWVAALILLAVSWTVAAMIVIRPSAGPALVALNLAPVVGIIVSAAVPLNANLAVHEVAAFSALVAGDVAMLLNAERLRGRWRVIAVVLSIVALAGISPAATLLAGRVGWGTLERIVIAPLIASLAAFGLALVLGGLVTDAATASDAAERPRTRRRTLATLVIALTLALTGVGTGITAGGATVVGAELTRVVNSFLVPN